MSAAQSQRDARSRVAMRAIVLLAVVLLATMWLATWQRSQFEMRQAIAAAQHANANLAIAYEENTDNALGHIDQLTRMIAIEYRDEGRGVGKAIEAWSVDTDLIRGLAIVTARGETLVATGDARGAGTALRERLAFHAAHPGTALRFTTPLSLRVGGEPAVRVVASRRLETPGGEFDGLIVAFLNPAFFNHFFTRVEGDPDGVISLVGMDGFAVARQTGKVSTYGGDMRSSTLFEQLALRPNGSFVSRGVRDGSSRLIGYRTMQEYPFVVMVGSTLEATAMPVRERTRLYFTFASAMSIAILLAVYAMGRFLARQRRDFDALSEAQARLRESEARALAITENMAGGVVTTTEDGTIVSVNAACCAMHGYRAEEMIGMPLWRLVAPSDRPGLAMRLEQMRSDKAAGHQVKEILAVRKDGSTFEAEVLNSGLEINGQRTMVGIVHDISQRKALERDHRRDEALYRVTFDQALIGIAHTGLDGRFMRVNRTACEMLGHTESEMLGMDYAQVTHPQDLPLSQTQRKDLLADPKHPFEHQAVRRLLRKDGSVLWALLSVSVVRRDDGTPEFFLTMVQDITELKRVERMKSEFVSTVSHELRSPLTSIRGSLGLLAGGVAGALPKPVRDLVLIAERNTERLIRLVNDILDTERMDSDRMQFDSKVTDLGALVARAVESMQGYALEHGVKLRSAVPGAAVAADVDPDRLIQVMTNLLSNAAKFSPPGGEVLIELARLPDGQARIEVTDRGPGIPKEFQPRMFQRFSQADASSTRAQPGTGLGLHIARGIVEKLGGSIGYRTAEGAGTTFHVTLPDPVRRRAAAARPALAQPA